MGTSIFTTHVTEVHGLTYRVPNPLAGGVRHGRTRRHQGVQCAQVPIVFRAELRRLHQAQVGSAGREHGDPIIGDDLELAIQERMQR